VDLIPFLHYLKTSSMEPDTHEISLSKEMYHPILVNDSRMDLSKHPFPIIDAGIMNSKKDSPMEYSDLIVKYPKFDGLSDVFGINDIDILSKAHRCIRSYFSFHDGCEHILKRKWREVLSDTVVSLTRWSAAKRRMLMFLIVPP